jgi:integrase/recombinase XerD
MLSTLSSFYSHHQVISPILKVEGVSGRSGNQKGFLTQAQNQSKTQVSYFKRKVKKRGDRKRLYPDEALQFYNSIGYWKGNPEDDRSVTVRDKCSLRFCMKRE